MARDGAGRGAPGALGHGPLPHDAHAGTAPAGPREEPRGSRPGAVDRRLRPPSLRKEQLRAAFCHARAPIF